MLLKLIWFASVEIAYRIADEAWRIQRWVGLAICALGWHDWQDLTLTKLNGQPARFRCCVRCERTKESL